MQRQSLHTPDDEGRRRGTWTVLSIVVVVLSAIAICFLLTSCTSTRKTVTTAVKTTDTSSSIRSIKTFDTASLVTMKHASDIDITYYFTNGDTAHRHLDTLPVRKKTIRSKSVEPDYAYDFPTSHSDLAEINVHIGSTSDSSIAQSSELKQDTTAKQRSIVQTVAQTSVTTKTTLPWWMYAGGALLIIFILLILLISLYKKFL